VKNVTLQFPVTPVPARETTYMCAVFEFPEPESDVHMIATTPLLDNRQVMHHALLFRLYRRCVLRHFSVSYVTPQPKVTDVAVGVPYECGMSAHPNCSTIISIWTLGQNGECIHNNAGVRLGVKGYTKMALQFHWNNPELSNSYQDSSGMTLHYTSNLRQYDSGVWMVGNTDFDIFPRQSHVTVEAKCSSTCTKTYLKEPVYVTAAWNHMHYLGVSQTIEHYRNGTWLRYITNDVIYSYDSPQTQEYITPIEVLPGDELKTTCHFNSMTRSKTTTFGDSTQQEMCFGFLTYYPEHALADKSCISFGSLSFCEPNSFKGCDWNRFWAEIGPFWYAVTTNCVYHTCYPECKETILAEQRRKPVPCQPRLRILHQEMVSASRRRGHGVSGKVCLLRRGTVRGFQRG
ncbi:hypothetical protein BaRGS_00033538, partial [Batillaria attramentaria]